MKYYHYFRLMHGHKIHNQNALHFVTVTVVGWVDVFTRQVYKDIVIDTLKYCQQNKGLVIHAFVIMSNHVHMVVKAKEGYELSDIIRDFKKYTARTIQKEISQNISESRQEWMLRLFKYFAKYSSGNKNFQFWRKGNKPIELYSPKWISQKILYIHNNPVNAGIVNSPEHYIYSSAKDYVGDKSLLEIEVVDLGFDTGYIDS